MLFENICLERLSFMEDIGCFILNSRWENGKLEFKHNACSNAILTYGYKSIIDGSQQTIKIDIVIGPSIIEEPVVQSLTSLLNEYFYEINIPCLTLKEIYSEKLTAALCRKTPAIRDYYDIWYAINSGFDFYEDSFLKLFTHKIQEDKFNYSFNKEWVEELLNKQIEMDLRPVLFNPNGADFNLSEIRNIVAQFYIDPALVETNTEE